MQVRKPFQADPKLKTYLENILYIAEYLPDHQIVKDFFMVLEKQVRQWLAMDPKEFVNSTSEKEILQLIIEASLPHDKKYFPIRAKLCFLRGLIHRNGFQTIKAHKKQAFLDFQDAANFGCMEAWTEVGDAYYEQIKNKPAPISKDPLFKNMLLAYDKGDNTSTLRLIENGYLTLYKDALILGDYDEAINIAKAIKNQLQEHPDIIVNAEVSAIVNNVSEIEQLKLLMIDAQKISKAYIELINNADVSNIEEQYLALSKSLSNQSTPNPIYDYYYAQILRFKARLLKDPADSHKRDGINQVANQIFSNIMKGIDYPSCCKPLLNFSCAMGLEDNVSDFMKLPRSSFDYLQDAANAGCYMAFSFLANKSELEKNDIIACQHYYMLGALANDPRCLISYFHRFLSPQLKEAIKTQNIETIVNLCKRTITTLNGAYHNPYIVTANKDYMIENMKEVMTVLEAHTYKHPLLTVNFWNQLDPINRGECIPLLEAMYNYEKISGFAFTERLKQLKALSKIASILLKKKSIENCEELQKQLKSLKEQISVAVLYIKKEMYIDELQQLASVKPIDRLRSFTKFIMKKHGLGAKYYMEYIDPLHRIGELQRVWEKAMTEKNYFEWLKDLDNYSTDITQRAIYLEPEDQEQNEVMLDNNSLTYAASKQAIKDGQYLYIVDEQKKVYMASEALSSAGHLHFYHASFRAGDPVLCGGEVVIKNGKITHINNGSGHYIPDINRLYDAIIHLKELNMLSDDFKIGILGMNVPSDVTASLNDLSFNQFRALYVRMTLKKNLTTQNVALVQNAIPIQNIAVGQTVATAQNQATADLPSQPDKKKLDQMTKEIKPYINQAVETYHQSQTQTVSLMSSRESRAFVRNSLQGVPIVPLAYQSAKVNTCDANICQVMSTSLFSSNIESTKKQSDDQVISGVTCNGYPFIIAVDGFFGCNNRLVFNFIQMNVVPLIQKYYLLLQNNPHQYEKIVKDWIMEIITLKRKNMGHLISFTLSIAITFPHNGRNYVSGFGVGDIGIVKRDQLGKLDQLATHTVVDGFKDGFDDSMVDSNEQVARMLNRASCFLREIKPGDEIVAYTYIPKTLELVQNTEDENVKKYKLNDALSFDKSTPLLAQLLAMSIQDHEAKVNELKLLKAFKNGDDCSMAAFRMPTHEQQLLLLKKNLCLELYTYITNLSTKKQSSFPALFSISIKDQINTIYKFMDVINGKIEFKALTDKEIKIISSPEIALICEPYKKYNVVPSGSPVAAVIKDAPNP